MSTLLMISLVTMSGLYCLAGISHFLKPKMFIAITPKWVPYPHIMNVVVGAIEIALGVALLFETTRSLAAFGIIALLVAVFPANVKHFQIALKKGKYVVATFLRLPLQLLLIYWAYTFV